MDNPYESMGGMDAGGRSVPSNGDGGRTALDSKLRGLSLAAAASSNDEVLKSEPSPQYNENKVHPYSYRMKYFTVIDRCNIHKYVERWEKID